MKPDHVGIVAAKRTEQFRQLSDGLSILQVAQQLGVGYAVARYWCERFGYGVSPGTRGRRRYMRQIRLAQIQKLPPNLTVAQVARRLKVSVTTARAWTRKIGYVPRIEHALQKVRSEQLQKVDWSMPNCQIALLLGLSRERVRQIRDSLGIAKV